MVATIRLVLCVGTRVLTFVNSDGQLTFPGGNKVVLANLNHLSAQEVSLQQIMMVIIRAHVFGIRGETFVFDPLPDVAILNGAWMTFKRKTPSEEHFGSPFVEDGVNMCLPPLMAMQIRIVYLGETKDSAVFCGIMCDGNGVPLRDEYTVNIRILTDVEYLTVDHIVGFNQVLPSMHQLGRFTKNMTQTGEYRGEKVSNSADFIRAVFGEEHLVISQRVPWKSFWNKPVRAAEDAMDGESLSKLFEGWSLSDVHHVPTSQNACAPQTTSDEYWMIPGVTMGGKKRVALTPWGSGKHLKAKKMYTLPRDVIVWGEKRVIRSYDYLHNGVMLRDMVLFDMEELSMLDKRIKHGSHAVRNLALKFLRMFGENLDVLMAMPLVPPGRWSEIMDLIPDAVELMLTRSGKTLCVYGFGGGGLHDGVLIDGGPITDDKILSRLSVLSNSPIIVKFNADFDSSALYECLGEWDINRYLRAFGERGVSEIKNTVCRYKDVTIYLATGDVVETAAAGQCICGRPFHNGPFMEKAQCFYIERVKHTPVGDLSLYWTVTSYYKCSEIVVTHNAILERAMFPIRAKEAVTMIRPSCSYVIHIFKLSKGAKLQMVGVHEKHKGRSLISNYSLEPTRIDDDGKWPVRQLVNWVDGERAKLTS